jgi:hypothetical protein
MIAAQLIKFVDYATHYLVEGLFIGDEGAAEAALVEAGLCSRRCQTHPPYSP